MMPAVIYIMGVSGSGKTTIGKKLSAVTGLPFFDADDFHSQANKEKMRNGQPLNDDDRKDWLYRLQQLAKDESGRKGAIIACSALKESYRDILSEGLSSVVHWVFLRGDYSLISERIKERKGHYMPVSLLRSQFDTLEIPAHAIVVDIQQTPDDIAETIIRALSA